MYHCFTWNEDERMSGPEIVTSLNHAAPVVLFIGYNFTPGSLPELEGVEISSFVLDGAHGKLDYHLAAEKAEEWVRSHWASIAETIVQERHGGMQELQSEASRDRAETRRRVEAKEQAGR